MNLTKNLGMLLLGIWLILNGLIALLSFSFQGLPLIMAILAIAAGALILVGAVSEAHEGVDLRPPFPAECPGEALYLFCGTCRPQRMRIPMGAFP